MIKKGIAVTAIFGISTLIQLVSQIVITRIFGASISLDTFLAAVALPTLLVTVIYGTLSDAFLPLYNEKHAEDEAKAISYLISHIFILGFISFLLTLVLGFLSQPISQLLYGARGETFVKEVAIEMQYMFYAVPLAIVATLFGSYYYTQKKFLRFPVAQLVGSVANIALIVLLTKQLGAWALVVAFVVNIFFQIVLVLPKNLSSVKFDFHSLSPLLLAWLPLIVGNIALRSDTLLIRSFGAGLSEGYLVYLNLVSKIFSLATGVMTIGIQVLLLPHLVEYLHKKEFDTAIATIKKAKISAIGISVFVTIVLMLLSPLLINFLFIGGKFSSQDAEITVSMLPLFALPAIGWGIMSVFFQPLIALKKQLYVGIINIVALALAWVTASMIAGIFGPLAAIAVGLIVLLFSAIGMAEFVWQKSKKKLLEQA